jgi:hypothetical protein
VNKDQDHPEAAEADELARIRREKLRALREKKRTEPPVVGNQLRQPAGSGSEGAGPAGRFPKLAEMLKGRAGQAEGRGALAGRLAGLGGARRGAGTAGGEGRGAGGLLERLATLQGRDGGSTDTGRLAEVLRERLGGEGGAREGGGRFPKLREKLMARMRAQQENAGGNVEDDGAPELGATRTAALEQDVRRLEARLRELEQELKKARSAQEEGSGDSPPETPN